MSFEWKGKTLRTNGDIMSAMAELENEDEGSRFLEAYQKVSPYAAANIGYMTGYFSREKGERIMHLTNTSHPIFGGSLSVAPEKALAMGIALGEAAKAKA